MNFKHATVVSMASTPKQKPEESYPVGVVLESFGRIVEYAGDIAEVVLNLTIERVVKQE
jgi:hypothetical protein